MSDLIKNNLLNGLIRYRPAIMGFMILWIVFLHARITFPLTVAGQILRFFQGCGLLGVDIFFLLSGFGLCFSKSSLDYKRFIKKRFFRILPAYWTVIAIETIIIVISSHKIYIGKTFRLLSGMEFISTGNLDYWFVSGILICYFLFPFINHLISNKKPFKNTAILIGLCISAAFLVTITGYLNYLLVFIIRIPSFILGVYLGIIAIEKKSFVFTKIQYFSLILLFSLGIIFYGVIGKLVSPDLRWNLGLYWYPGVISSFPCCILFIKFCTFLEKHLKIIWKSLSFIGGCTLEIYLINTLLLNARNTVTDIHFFTIFNNSITGIEIGIASISIFLGIALANCLKYINTFSREFIDSDLRK